MADETTTATPKAKRGRPQRSDAEANTEATDADGDGEASGRGAPKRPTHPNVGSSDPNVYPFREVPADYDPDTMANLRRRDFAHEATFFDYRANLAERAMNRFRGLAREAREQGDSKQRAAAKRLVKMTEKIAALRQQLEAGGVDINEVLAAAATPTS